MSESAAHGHAAIRIEPTIAGVRRAVAEARASGRRVGFVPTMGALHAGHESLMIAARAATDFVVASVFVNPTQFGPQEDLSRYPRTFEADVALCGRAGVDVVFAPAVAEVYPSPTLVWVQPTQVSDGLCGASRPGHFRGVATVVAKLLNMVGPDAAFFGQKDAQQCAVIRRMVADLNWPVEVVICPTVRESDGLAMSSRNRYLLGEDRRNALCLWRALQRAEALAAAGVAGTAELSAAMAEVIAATPSVRLDYAVVVDADSLGPITELPTDGRVALAAVAAFVGPARLIDNAQLRRARSAAAS